MDRTVEFFKKWAQIINARYFFNKLITEGMVEPKLFDILDYAVDPNGDAAFQHIVSKDTILYRARIISPEDCKTENGIAFDEKGRLQGFNKVNSAEAPLGKPGPGRNNIGGVSYLYLASNVGTACAEVRPTNHDLISVARFISRRDLRLINFAEDVTIPKEVSDDIQVSLPEFFTLLMNSFRVQVYSNREYATTQEITDYVRKAGFDGIEYRSSFTDKPCFTIFNSHHSIMQYEDSTIYFPISSSREFIEINTKDKAEGGYTVKEDEIDPLVEKVRDFVKQSIEKNA